MNQYKTNLALIMDILDITTPQIMEVANVDKTQVSRWRSGARKLMPDSAHAHAICDYLIEADSPTQNEIRQVLTQIYPLGFDTNKDIKHNLVNWLTLPNQVEVNKTKKRTKFFYIYMAEKVDRDSEMLVDTKTISDTTSTPPKGFPLKSVTGYKESQGVLSDVVDYLADINQPSDIIFVCPEGIDIITADESYSMDFLDRTTKMLKKGYKANVVLRTDFKMSDVASFAGPWLVAHLSGYIKSWYYDDFRKIETDKILIWVDGKVGIRISGDEYKCEIYTDPEIVKEIGDKCKEYKESSVQRFHYNFFKDQQNYLKGITPRLDGHSYIYQRLPNACIGGLDYLDELGVTDDEKDFLTQQFMPFTMNPSEYNEDVYYMLCIDDIEEALDKPKYLHFALGDMLDRRIYVETQVLVNQLVRLKKLNKNHKNFHLCFMKNDVFEKIVMEIGVWEWTCAIGWIKGVQSTATNDNFNTLTLHGFCATVWGKIPALFKSKAAANRHLNKLLSRAQKFGYKF